MKMLKCLITCLVIYVLIVTLAHAEDKGEIFSAETRTGSITNTAQTDSFTFSGEADQGVVIVMSLESGNLNSYIRLYAPDATLETSAMHHYYNNMMINEHKLLQSGIYTIVVGDADADGTGDYSLSFVLIPGSTVSSQDSDGGDIFSGETKSGTLDPYADTDIYTFNGEEVSSFR